MFKFKSPQKIFKIGNVSIGGQPGELPKVLFGTIFYGKHKIVEDPKKGIFDKKKAEELINKQEELSDLTGNPCGLDVVCISLESACKFIDFVAETTDCPISADIWNADIKIKVLNHIGEVGLSDRIIYNSIMSVPYPKEDELNALRDSKVKSSIILCYNLKDRGVDGVLSLLKGTPEQKGLLDIAASAGIEKPLVDATIFTYIPSIGVGAKACYAVKDNFGLPVGGSPGNATTVWKQPKKWGPGVFEACEAAAEVVPLAFGADYLFYGPVESAPWVFPACAGVDSMIAAASNTELGTKILTKEHPIYKLFPDVVEKIGIQ